MSTLFILKWIWSSQRYRSVLFKLFTFTSFSRHFDPKRLTSED